MNEKYVLLVEDNEDDVALTQIAFRRSQVPNELVVVTDGQEALDFLFGQGQYAGRDTSQTPAVVLLDLKLPCVSGQEVLRQIRMDEKISRLPVVVLSSTTNMEEIKECEQLGISRYYRKPGNFEEFAKIIQDIRISFMETMERPASN
jgi:two-component system, response regulator